MVNALMPKNPKGAGRKQKYSDEELCNIIDSFLINEFKHDISPSVLAKYAEEKMGYYGIKYYHFSKRDEVAKKIEDIKRVRIPKFVSPELQSFQNINIDSFVDKYFDKPKLKRVLLELQQGQKDMYKKVMEIEKSKRELKSQLKQFQDENQALKTELKDIAKEVSKLEQKNFMMRKLIDVDNHTRLLQYGWDNTNIECDNLKEQYLLILKSCGVIVDRQSDEIESSYNKPSKNRDAREKVISELKNRLETQIISPAVDIYDSDIPDVSAELDKLLGID